MTRVALLLVFVIGCAGRAAPATPSPAPPQHVEAPPPEVVKPPGYREAVPQSVYKENGEIWVHLTVEDSDRYLRWTIGNSEALAIETRLRGKVARPPLAVDVIDEVVRRLGGTIVKVQIDDYPDDAFRGPLHIRTRDRIIVLAARPSDGIALAIGNRAPIYVAQTVLDEMQRRAEASRAP